MKPLFSFLLLIKLVSCVLEFPKDPLPIPENEISPSYWEKQAREQFGYANKNLDELAKKAKKAKNVILFLGDGMGLQTVAGGRFYKSFENIKTTGQAMEFLYEQWDFNTVARTYDLQTMVTDSASSATAYLTGTKTRTGMLGVTGAVNVKQCVAYAENEILVSALTAAAKAGKATGIVTSARVTHASPAGAFGHISFRDWECDADIKKDCNDTAACVCKDLAMQLALDNLDINVILGGGQAKFYPNTMKLPSNESKVGERLDDRQLPNLWLAEQKKLNRKAMLMENFADFIKNETPDVDYLFGLFTPSHLPFVLDRPPNEPGLVELTRTAIKLLQRNPNGFFLFVEGARIDHGHHDNKAHQALAEMLELNQTIAAAVEMLNLDETLLIVTADHSHSFELVGQPSRFESLLDLDKGYGPKTLDKRNIIPASYMNGPGATVNVVRVNLTAVDKAERLGKDYLQPALVPLQWSTHGGDDVGVYASGPFSYMFHRTVDNTFIAQTMKWAMCVDPFSAEPHCTDTANQQKLSAVLLSILLAHRFTH